MTEPQPAPDQQPARIAELEARVEQLQTEIAQRDNSLARVISAESPRDKIIYGIVHEAFIAGFHYRWGIRLLEGGQLVPLRPIEIRTGPQFDFARESRDPWPVDRSSVAGSVVLDDRLHRLADCSGPDMAPYQRDVDGISTLNDRLGIRIGSRVTVPIRFAAEVVGTWSLFRTEVRPYTDDEVAGIERMAEQMGLAIGNARAAAQLEQRNRELAEALEQQTATAEVLEVISRAPSDLQSALDEVVLKASRLLDSRNAVVLRTSEAGGERVAVARDGAVARDSRLDAPTPAPNDRWEEQITTIEMRHGGPEAIQSRYPRLAELWRSTGTGSSIAAPLTTASGLFGRLVVSRQSPEPYTAGQVQLFGTFAAQAVIAIENARLFNELQDRNREVTEALDQQTAMAEVLKIISTSATQLQPVLDAVVENAARLCGVPYAGINLVDGDVLRPSSAARHHTMRLGLGPVSGFPLDRSIPPARVVIDRAPVHIYGSPEEIEAAWPEAAARTRERGIEMTQAFYGTPLMSKGEPVGVLHVMRETGEPFSSQQMSLLQTFADQAVIAIENARLFNELQERNREVTEALDQQTAMAEVLEIISKSATDAQPVLDALAERAARLCAAEAAQLQLVEGDMSRVAARFANAETARLLLPQDYTAPIANRIVGEAVEKRARVHIWGKLEDFTRFSETVRLYEGVEAMSWLSVPLFRDDAVIGCLQVSKSEPYPFADTHIALLEAFADQAVIAMENARLFNELEDRNREVTEALEQQTATSAVLQAISRSAFDLESVLSTLTENLSRLSKSGSAAIFTADEEGVMRLRASFLASPEARRAFQSRTWRAGDGSLIDTVISTKELLHVPDIEGLPESAERGQTARASGLKTLAIVPLLRDDIVVGFLGVGRTKVSPFTQRELALIQTFADQAVIAIENARLFNELQERNRQVTEALDRQTATADVLGIISRSPYDTQPVFDAVVESAARLCGAEHCVLYSIDADAFTSTLAAQYALEAERMKYAIGTTVPLEGRVVTQAVLDRKTVHMALGVDELAARYPKARANMDFGTQERLAILQIPLFRDAAIVGVLQMHRFNGIAYEDSEIALVETFADQAEIAIENARLFNELQDRNREVTEALEQQTATAGVLQAISRTAFDLQSVLDTLTENVARLGRAETAVLFTSDDDITFRVRASFLASPEARELYESTTWQRGDGSTIDEVISSRALVHIPDAANLPSDTRRGRTTRGSGLRTVAFVPLLRDDAVVGVLGVGRQRQSAFNERELALVRTFADQAVIAIENARLFQEIQEKSEQLEIAGKHRSQFMATMSHELRTPLNAIIGYAELLQEECTDLGDDDYLPDLGKIQTAARHLLTLINDILDLSRVEAGRMTLYLEDFDINTLIDEVGSIVSPLMDKNGNTFVVACPQGMGEMRADVTKLRQALFNLLQNAAKFTEQGTVTLRVGRPPAASTGSEAVPMVEFVVADTCTGISEEAMGRIFVAFEQADASISFKHGGTGLGLPISRQFCRLMGGDITVESKMGEGCAFTVTLPATVMEFDLETPDENGSIQGEQTTVLVIDDDPAARDLLRRTLEKEGYGVLLAAGGEEGLRLARAQPPPAAITLDVIMPGMDGWEVLAALKADPATAAIPVIVLTMLDNTNIGFTLGAAGFMTKPVDRDRLAALLGTHTGTTAAGAVLVVDDDPAAREMLRRQLQGVGWAVEEAENGRVALDKIAVRRPALILLDLVMPVLDGFGVVAELQAHEEWRDIPVVVVTAKDMTPAERELLNGGVQRIIQKGSVTRDALLADVRALVARATHADAHAEQGSSE